MQKFNAVLMPSAGFKDKIVSMAQEHYTVIADGYCLSKKVYPHITLVQFAAEDMPMVFIDGLFQPRITGFRVREGEGKHAGYVWVQYDIAKEDWLVALQASVRESLGDVEIRSNQGEKYEPHITFARIPKSEEAAIAHLSVIENNRPWIFTIGHSDENGQFLG